MSTPSHNKLWSNVVDTNKCLLVYSSKSKDTSSGLVILKSLVVLQRHSSKSVFFDVTSRLESPNIYIVIIARQLQKRYAVCFCKESGARRLIKSNFLDDQDAIHKVLTMSLVSKQDNVRILSMDMRKKETNAIRIAVSNLSLTSEL